MISASSSNPMISATQLCSILDSQLCPILNQIYIFKISTATAPARDIVSLYHNHNDHDEDQDEPADDHHHLHHQQHYHDNHDVQQSCLQSIVRHSEADGWPIVSIVGQAPTLHCVTGITRAGCPHYNAICSRSGLGPDQ